MLSLDWTDEDRALACRACGESSTGRLIARIRGGEPEDIPVVRCPVCGSLELLDSPLDWSPNDEVVDDYVEAGAGIGTIVSFLQLADPEPVTRFLDVGCNYGFTVDYGRFSYGWDAVGVEPSLAGARGAAELGIDIRGEYLSEQSQVGDGYELALSSEVVEHVPEPVGFLRAIRERLADGGRVVLTTPDAATVDPTLPELDAIHALSPGFHVFLTSEEGLRRLLMRAGFGSVAIRSTGGTLYAVATAEPDAEVSVANAPQADQLALEAYYLARFETAPAGSALSAGMVVRLLRSKVNRAAFDGIEADAERAVAAYDLRHSAELAEPWATRAAIEASDAAPRALPGAAYALGMLELLHRRRSDRALAYFELACSAAEIWIRTVGMPDLDIDDLLVQSRQLVEHSRGQLAADRAAERELRVAEDVIAVRAQLREDPVGAVDSAVRLLADSSSESRPVFAELAARSFVDAVVGHDAAPAEDARSIVAEEAPALAAEESAERASTGLDALYALGVAAELRGDHAEAREWYGRCLAACAAAPSAPSAAGLLGLATAALARLP